MTRPGSPIGANAANAANTAAPNPANAPIEARSAITTSTGTSRQEATPWTA